MPKRFKHEIAEDGVLAYGNYGWGDMTSRSSEKSKRRNAITAMCQDLPDDLYQKFREKMKNRVWFIPSVSLGGCTKQAPSQKLIYISPIWEAAEDKLVQYIVLHEMLHVILGHNTELDSGKEADRKLDDAQENEVERKIQELGLVTQGRKEANEFLASAKTKLGIQQ